MKSVSFPSRCLFTPCKQYTLSLIFTCLFILNSQPGKTQDTKISRDYQDANQLLVTQSDKNPGLDNSPQEQTTEVIRKTDCTPTHSHLIFTGIPADEILACGMKIPDWPKVIVRDHFRQYQVEPSEQIYFTPCGGKQIIRSWTVKTPEGDEISRRQNITYSDNEPPFLKIGPDARVDDGMEVPLPVYEAGDHGCSSFTVDVSEEKATLSRHESTIVRRYVAIDGCGNQTSLTQHILVTHRKEVDQSSSEKSVSAFEFDQ